MSGSVLTNLYRQWIWLGIPFMVGALVVLGTVIRRVIAIVRKAHLFRVPPAETQEVEFTEAGSVILSIEGPRFTRRFAHVGFELMDATGQRVPSRPTLFRARTSGISTVRMELRAFNIPRPGRYVLRMTSLGPAREKDREHAASPAWNLTVIIAAQSILAASFWAQSEAEWDYLISMTTRLRAALS